MKRIVKTAGAVLGFALLASSALAADVNCSASSLNATQRLNCQQLFNARATTSTTQYYYIDRGTNDRYYRDMNDTRTSAYDTTGTRVNKELANDKYARNDNPGEPRSARGSESAYNAPTKWGRSIGDKDRFNNDERYNDERYAPAAGSSSYYYGDRYTRTGARVNGDRYYPSDSRTSAYDTTGSRINKDAADEQYYRNDNPGEPRSQRGSESAYTAPTKWGTSVADKDVYSDNSYPSYSRRDYRYYNGY